MADGGPVFDYHQAFSRNLGWFTLGEQEVLRGRRVAIAGLGGVGGSHLLTLARMGVGSFTLAEMDSFELANFNRQAGASCSTVGQSKLDVLMRMARDINPELGLTVFPQGIAEDTVDAFLDGVDLYVDSLDFFAFPARRAVFAACHRRGVPAVTAAPLGMGTALLCFMPGGMTFEQYFRLDRAKDDTDRAVRFLAGLSPRMLHAGYLMDPGRVDLSARRGPSTAAAIQMCAGVAGAEAVKILLGRGRVRAAPWGRQFDAYRGTCTTTWRPWGNANPLQQLLMAVIRWQLRGRLAGQTAPQQA